MNSKYSGHDQVYFMFQVDEHRLVLVNITQKDKLPCPSEYLPLLWYFFKPHMFSKSTRVIPMLEYVINTKYFTNIYYKARVLCVMCSY